MKKNYIKQFLFLGLISIVTTIETISVTRNSRGRTLTGCHKVQRDQYTLESCLLIPENVKIEKDKWYQEKLSTTSNEKNYIYIIRDNNTRKIIGLGFAR